MKTINDLISEEESRASRRREILSKVHNDPEFKKAADVLKEIFALPESERINLQLYLLERKDANLSLNALRRAYGFQTSTDALIDRFDELPEMSRNNVEYFIKQKIMQELL